jgi:hypothetical protein
MGAVSSSTRGVFGGGAPTTNVIEFITISTLGNSSDFGDLFSSTVRGVFAGGSAAGSSINIIDFVTIMSTGNAVDFGDLTQKRQMLAGCSNGHGGL